MPRRWGSAGGAGEGWGWGRAAREVLAPRVLPLALRAPEPPRVPRSEPRGGATFPLAAGVRGWEGVR